MTPQRGEHCVGGLIQFSADLLHDLPQIGHVFLARCARASTAARLYPEMVPTRVCTCAWAARSCPRPGCFIKGGMRLGSIGGWINLLESPHARRASDSIRTTVAPTRRGPIF